MCTMSMPGAQRGEKRAGDALKLELYVIISSLVWVLEPDLVPFKSAKCF